MSVHIDFRPESKETMTLIDLLVLLIVAGVLGAIAQAISGYERGGCLVAIAVGFIGAMVGMWLSRVTGIPDLLKLDFSGTTIPVLWTVIGGALFVSLVAFLTRGRRTPIE